MTNWIDFINKQYQEDYFQNVIEEVLRSEERIHVYPEAEIMFRAFELCPFEETKVVILGQDPYHGPYQANGLAFSVNEGLKLPPSLKNIYKEIEQSLNVKMPNHGDLTSWAEQGVLLLNTSLTVEEGRPGSHSNIGWQEFTRRALQELVEYQDNVIFMAWGKHAQKMVNSLKPRNNIVLPAAHPSPLSANKGFFGCDHFKKANEYLQQFNKEPIKWEKLYL